MTTITLELTDREITQMRQIADWLPLNRYAPLIVKLCNALPLLPESAAEPSSADSSLEAPQVLETSGGFQLRAVTPRGQSVIDELIRRMPHGGTL